MILPRIQIRSGYTSIIWNDPRNMDVVREILEVIDLNAPWLPLRLTRADWLELTATKARIGLHYPKVVRGMYGPHDEPIRIYPVIDLTPGMVDEVVRWLEDELDIVIYHSHSSKELHTQTEDVPQCPGCSSDLVLTWKRWKGNEHNIVWLCPVYNDTCKEEIGHLWPRKCPELVHDVQGIPVLFHQWSRNGIPIPPEYRREPMTEWTITSLNDDPDIIKANMEVQVKRTARVKAGLFTDEQSKWISANYKDCEVKSRGGGPRKFADAFPHARISKYDIQRMACSLGATRSR